MNKQEQYYNYIVDDLISRTEIDYKVKSISLPKPPFFSQSSSTIPLEYDFVKDFLKLLNPYYQLEYMMDIYGLRKDEVRIIWRLYSERIESLI